MYRILLVLLSLCLFATPVFAVDDTELLPRGYLPYGEDLPPATIEQIDEALDVTMQCKAASYSSTYYDCDCTGMKFLDLRRVRGDGVANTTLLLEAQKNCPNATNVAGSMLNQCYTWAKASRPYNYKEFCDCFASEFAQRYEKNTSENDMVRESQMTDAYITCDGGRNLDERLAKQSLIERLKEDGLFKTLFPGAGGK